MTTAKNHQHDPEEPCAAARLCVMEHDPDGYGLHLTRTRWDPYPWVSDVTKGSVAERAGIRQGDCVLQVNGHDLLGRPITDTGRLIRARTNSVQVLVWNYGGDSCGDIADIDSEDGSEQALCCGPMPASLRRLAKCLSAILAALECPVCLGTIAPPAHQCANGHLICVRCRARAERCPVCRLRFNRGRSLLADQVYEAMTDAFELHAVPPGRRPARLRQRLLGSSKREVPEVHVSPPRQRQRLSPAPHRLLSRLLGKSSSVENLSATNPSRLTPPSATELRTKSLSSSEIFLSPLTPTLTPAGSPVPSRPGSMTSLHWYPGSVESLNEPLPVPVSLCACPFGEQEECHARVPVSALTAHGGRAHGSPVLLHWGPRTSVSLPLPSPEPVIAVQSSAKDIDSDKDQLVFVRIRNGNEIQATMADTAANAARWRLLVTPLRSPGAPVTISFGSLQLQQEQADDQQPDSGPIWSKAGVHITHVAEGGNGGVDLEIRPTDLKKTKASLFT